ncbi:MAG: biotin/lipoyl-binding protein, partial [Actinobacteria bacterium]|nr:biotin/lipoyl-binding protein [Actinomycetota bacterium]
YGSAESGEAGTRETISVEVDGRRFDVTLPAGLGSGATSAATGARRSGARKANAAATGTSLVAPMQGTVVKVAVADGATVNEGDLIVVVEAMKMEQPLNAHKSGTISGLKIAKGETITAGSVICEIN